MVNYFANETTEINGQAIENVENNGQINKASIEFKVKVKKLNAKKEGFNIDDVIDVIQTALVEVIELEITTWVPESSTQLENQSPSSQEVPKPGNRIYTVINLIDGDITNEIGSQFVGSGPYTELREFHLSQVKESREIIQKNIESLKKLYEFFVEIIKSRKTSQQSSTAVR